MSKAVVDQILEQIQSLSDDDRRLLDEELARRLEQEWQAEAAAARELARQRSIDQVAIDRVIERRRYGQ